MQRRHFFKSALATAAILSLPSIAVSQPIQGDGLLYMDAYHLDNGEVKQFMWSVHKRWIPQGTPYEMSHEQYLNMTIDNIGVNTIDNPAALFFNGKCIVRGALSNKQIQAIETEDKRCKKPYKLHAAPYSSNGIKQLILNRSASMISIQTLSPNLMN